MFVSKLADADAEATETQVWLDFAHDCGYLSQKRHDELVNGYEEVGKMLGKMMTEPEKFTMRNAEDKRQKAVAAPLPSARRPLALAFHPLL